MSNSSARTLVLSALTSVGLVFGAATAAIAGSPAASVTDNPSYQAYQRLNGFSVPEPAEFALTAATRSSSYERYLNLNGFAVEQTGADKAPATAANQSLRDYQYLNGFL